MENKNIEETLVPTPEEKKQEEEFQAEVKEDEVRNSIIEKYELDEEEQSELIDKLTSDQLEQRKAFGKVIGQKIKYREAATKEKPEPLKKEKEIPDVGALVSEKFEQRDLESMDLPDEIKSEVQKLAKVQGISVRQAVKDSYIEFKKQEYEEAKKVEDAAISPRNKGKSVKFDAQNPPEVDVSTEEGRKEWDEYTEWLKLQEK